MNNELRNHVTDSETIHIVNTYRSFEWKPVFRT